MQVILRQLIDRLDAIAMHHDEVGDTVVREAMSDAVFRGFLRPVPEFSLPSGYAMLDPEGDRLVERALAEFLPAARRHAAESGADSFHDRLALFQDDDVRSTAGTYYDDYFGWADPKNYDAAGNWFG